MIQEEITIYGLAYNCPTLQRRGDCPFMALEHLSYTFGQKVKWINELSKEEIEKILKHHLVCSDMRT